MEEVTKVLAIDFGASSGRAIIGTYDNKTINLQEIHRFSNDPVILRDSLHWDVLRLYHEIKQSIIKAKNSDNIKSIGIDTWGVDFGLVDKEGNLLDNPFHYRDKRTKGVVDKVAKQLDLVDLYRLTGNQIMEINTLFQVYAMKLKGSKLLELADKLLMMPDLFNYLLTDKKASEYTIASTTQMLDINEKRWSDKLMEDLDFTSNNIFAEIVEPGTILGKLSPNVCEELEINPIDVVAVAEHDTQSAMISVPNKEEDYIFLSCGTWSLLGTEIAEPIANKKTQKYNLTNEGFINNHISLLKNIVGLWLVQESRRQWIKLGKEYSFATLDQLASEVGEINSYIDPDDPVFLSPGNIPDRIRNYCRERGQYIPKTEGEIIRCIYQSLAKKYAEVIREIEDVTGKTYNKLYVIGGGVQSRLFCQIIANYIKRTVVAGPVEATVIGNIVMQLLALNKIANIEEAKKMICQNQEITIYEPK